MRRNYPDAIVGKAIDFIRDNAGGPLSLRKIAEVVALSPRHLLRVFHEVTGKSVISYLNHLRIDNAKSLLRRTDLSITEIAYEVGFSDYNRFAIAFRKYEGTNAAEFRRMANAINEVPTQVRKEEAVRSPEREWLCDRFEGDRFKSWWKPDGGDWTCRDRIALGKGLSSNFILTLTKPLPENFRIRFDAKVLVDPTAPSTDLFIRLRGVDAPEGYCSFCLGRNSNTMGMLFVRGSQAQWNEAALVKPGQWQSIELRAKDSSISLLVDGQEVFGFRDAFPISYSKRCLFEIGGWQNQIAVRNFVVHDLGFLSLVSPVREGDSLYNAGIYDGARDFYMRHLASGLSIIDTMELRCKIGVCFLRESMFSQAREWLDKVVFTKGSAFWFDRARLTRAEINWAQGRLPSFLQDIRDLFPDGRLRDAIREIAQRAMEQYRSDGFYDRSLQINQTLLDLEEPDSYHANISHWAVAQDLSCLGRPNESQLHYRKGFLSPTAPLDDRLATRVQFSRELAMLRKFDESESILLETKAMTRNPFFLAYCDIYRSFNARAGGRIEEASRMLEAVDIQYPEAASMVAFARIHRAFLCISTGKITQARKILEQAEAGDPQYFYFQPGSRDALFCPLHLRAGEYGQAANMLESGARIGGHGTWQQAQKGVKAGILHEIGGNEDAAKSTWDWIAHRYPADRYGFFGALASALLSDKEDHLEKMPYHPEHRSEMFYICALLYEMRGNRDRAQTLLQMSLEEDPTLRWPAWLAREKLTVCKSQGERWL